MEPMNHLNNQGEGQKIPTAPKTPADIMAALSLIAGICGVLFCLSPLIQFPLGAAAVTFSFVARRQGKRGLQTVIGMATGIIAIVLSLIIFACIVYVYQVLLNDPVLGPIYNDMYQQYQQFIGNLGQAA